MRIPRLRLKVWGMMVATAVLGLGLMLAREFRNGVPPEFVIRGFPARIERLRPGMSRSQVHEILGLDTSWAWGGTGPTFGVLTGDGRVLYESYGIGQERPESSTGFILYRAEIFLYFDIEGNPETMNDGSLRLVEARFSRNSEVVAEMKAAPRRPPKLLRISQ